MTYEPKNYVVIRDVTPEECFWLSETVKKDTVVYEAMKYTYGCGSVSGLVVTLDPTCDYPFFEIPVTALSYNGNTVTPDYLARTYGQG